MRSRAEGWTRRWAETAQPYVDEPVITAGLFTPAGTEKAATLSRFLGLAAATGGRKRATERAGGLATAGAWKSEPALLAVTKDRVVVFRSNATGRKVKGQLASWDRRDLKVATAGRGAVHQLLIDVQSICDHSELEAGKEVVQLVVDELSTSG